MQKLDISAIVVGFNEAELLKSCLGSIGFCKEVLYFDLGSKDSSVQIAKDAGATVHIHEKVLGPEWIHSKFATSTTFNWVLITDPDEVIDVQLAFEIQRLLENGIEENIGSIKVPCLYYYKGRRLRGTPWGGMNKRIFLVHNQRFSFTPQVHVGRKLLSGYQEHDVNDESQCVHHYWMRDFDMLLEKHKRYLKNEGEARFNEGYRTNYFKIAIAPFRQFYFSYITKKGYLDKWIGLGLSLFWAWYQTAASIKLMKVQRKNNSQT